jgi:fumarate reductase subunit D
MKRSSQPVFWLLFGAGGMLSALVGAMLVFITGVAAPLNLGVRDGFMGYANAFAFAQAPFGKLTLFTVVSLFLWHGVHRIFHSLHDLGMHSGRVARIACYGFALAGTLVALGALAWIGWPHR